MCFFFLMNVLGKRSDLPFSRKSDRKKEKSTVSITHAQNIICSQTQWDGIAHEHTIICRQLFAGHVVGSRPMKRKKFASNDNTNYDALITDWSVRCPPNAWFPRVMSNQDPCMRRSDGVFFETMFNKTIIRFGFRDIRFIQGLGKCY